MSVLGRHTLVGVLNEIALPAFPAVIGPLALYVRVHQIHGTQSLQLEFVKADDDSVVMNIEGKIGGGTDPLGSATLVLAVPPVKVLAPGRYLWQARANGNPIASASVYIRGEGTAP